MSCTFAPSPWVVRFAGAIAPGGRVLDLACGGGRHARWLAERGHPVHAIDRDPSHGPVLSRVPDLTFDLLDLETPGLWDAGPPPLLAGRRYAGIVVTRYLWRPVLPWLAEALLPGGILLYETFADGQQRLGRPSRPEFLLRAGELLQVYGPLLDIVAYEDGLVQPSPADAERGAVAARLQRLCARRRGDGAEQLAPVVLGEA